MGIVVDLIIIGIVVLSTFLAYRKGLVKLAIGLCAFAISIVATVILYQPISNLVINTTGIDEAIEDAIYEKANDIMTKEQNETSKQIMETTKNDMLPETARNLADAVAKLPILEQLNKVGGILYGIARGLLIIYVGLLVLGIPGKINPNHKVKTSIEQSVLGKTMEQNNVLNVFF